MKPRLKNGKRSEKGAKNEDRDLFSKAFSANRNRDPDDCQKKQKQNKRSQIWLLFFS